MAPTIRVRDDERGSLAGILPTPDNYPVRVRLLVVVSLTGRRVQLKVVAIAERKDERVPIAVEVAIMVPLFGKKGAENVTSSVLNDKHSLFVVFQLSEEGQMTVPVATGREEERPLGEAASSWQMVGEDSHFGFGEALGWV